jgi:PPOX class probable FMN-dependent enzyme
MEGAPFRKLLDVSIAKSRQVRGGNYVQLATTTADGMPRCRTVVQRGMHGSVFKFITDNRSEKVEQITRPGGGACEMVWWFLKTSEQYRVRGQLRLVGHNEPDEELASMRKQQWGNLRDSAREQFYWSSPGLPLDEAEADVNAKTASHIPAGGRGEDGKVLPAPGEFLLMLLDPERVHYLRLTDNHACVFEKADGAWETKEVNP